MDSSQNIFTTEDTEKNKLVFRLVQLRLHNGFQSFLVLLCVLCG
jgi:hypothetical protein